MLAKEASEEGRVVGVYTVELTVAAEEHVDLVIGDPTVPKGNLQCSAVQCSAVQCSAVTYLVKDASREATICAL
jgi:hypothetical protein